MRAGTRRDWAEAAALLAAVAALALALGVPSGLLGPVRPDLGPAALARAAAALVAPALIEELAFRGPLLARRLRTMPLAALLLLAYVAWHPVGAWLQPDFAHVLADPIFLLIVVALGLACTASVWRSRSLLPAVVMHWAVVAGWIVLFGGLRPEP